MWKMLQNGLCLSIEDVAKLTKSYENKRVRKMLQNRHSVTEISYKAGHCIWETHRISKRFI